MAIVRLEGAAERASQIYFEVDTSTPPIGEGGMGRVYKGTCVDAATKMTRPVAIKFLFDGLPEHAIERARREASIKVKNDNVVEMLGFIETETLVDNRVTKHYHVVSELLHGVSLMDIFEGRVTDKNGEVVPFAEKMLNEFKTDSTHFAKKVISNVLAGLVALHDAGYVHRDIDPSNIMLTDDGHIKLIDFGIAKQVNKLTTSDRALTTAGVFMGKAEYAAPELAIGDTKHQDQTTDIYAIGILLYQCIVGHVPFEGTTTQVLDMQLHKKLPLAVIKDKALRQIITVATAKPQEERYQTASQMRVALENVDGLKRKMNKATRNKIVAGILTVVLIVSGTIGFLAYRAAAEKAEAERAEKEANESLRKNATKFLDAGDDKFAEGEEHGEGFDVSYIEAYQNYSKAVEFLNKVTDDKVQVNDAKAKLSKVHDALVKTQEELENNITDFKSMGGMDEAITEFQQRIDKIQNTLNNK